VCASTVTWRSSIASRSADWVFGDARLISSASSTLAKIPPGRNWNSSAARFHTDTPVTSEGSRSGVNWIRWHDPPIDAAMALASEVLPTPGTSSMRRWPSASRHTSARWTCSRLPWMTRSTLTSSAENKRPNDESRLGAVASCSTNTSRAGIRRYQRARRARRQVPCASVTSEPDPWFWWRAALLVLVRPHLWWTALVQTMRLARRRWWARPPFLPLPDADYLRFRFETQYGGEGRPDPRDLVVYLEWCHQVGR
jgi:hypothetical protein